MTTVYFDVSVCDDERHARRFDGDLFRPLASQDTRKLRACGSLIHSGAVVRE